MNERIKGLYQQHILSKSKDQTHVGQIKEATHILEAYNPMCGDKYTLYLKLSEGVIHEASFEGFGCAISKASTAVLTELAIGKSIEVIKSLVDDFLDLIDVDAGRNPEEITQDNQLLAFAAAREFPERKTCASLSWEELKEIL